MQAVAIVQARMGSSRLPNKVMMPLCGKPVLWHIFSRVMRSKKVDKLVVATSILQGDDRIEAFALQNKISVFRGSEENVLERFYFAAKEAQADVIVRLTGDNAFVCPEIIDDGLSYYEQRKGLDYLYYRNGLPLGVAVEIITFSALERAYREATDKECLEHVTPYLYQNPGYFQCENYPCLGEDYSRLRWTMDTKEDYELVKCMYENMYEEGEYFGYMEALQAYQAHTQWSELNKFIPQNMLRYQGEK